MADGKLVFDTRIDQKNFDKGLSSIKSKGSKLVKGVTDTAKKTASMVNNSIKGVAVGFGAIGIASLKVGSDFEASMSNVGAVLSDVTDGEMEQMRLKAKELGRTSAFSASEAAQGMEELARAGFNANEVMEAMPAMLDLAAAGQLEVAEAADITSNMLNIFGLEGEGSAQRVADTLAAAASSSATDVKAIGSAMEAVGPIANALGYEIEGTSAAIGILADSGITGSKAGKHLSIMMRRMADESGPANRELKKLGISAQDSNGNMRSLNDIMEDVTKATDGMTDGQKSSVAANIAGSNAMGSFLGVINKGPGAISKLNNELKDSQGTAKEMADKQLDNLKGSFTMLKSAAEGLGIVISESFNKPIRASIDWLKDWVNTITKVLSAGDDFKDSLKDVGALTDAFGDDLEGLKSGAEGVAQILGIMATEAVLKLADVIPDLVDKAVDMVDSVAQGLLDNKDVIGEALSEMLMSGIGGYAKIAATFFDVGVNLIESILDGFAENSESIGDGVVGLVKSVQKTISSNLPSLLESGFEILTGILDGMVDAAPEMMETSLQLLDDLHTVFVDNTPLLLEVGGELLFYMLEGMIESLPILIDFVLDFVGMLVDLIIDNAELIIEAAVLILETLVTGLLDSADLIYEKLPALVLAIVEALVDNIDLILEVGVDLLMALIDGLLDNLDEILDATIDIILALVDAVLDNLGPILGAGLEILTALLAGLLTVGGKVTEAVKELTTKIIDKIKEVDWIQLGIDILTFIAEGLIKVDEFLSDAMDGLGEFIIDALDSGIQGVFGIGKSIVTGLWNGMKSLTGWLGNKVSSIGDTVKDKFKDIFNINSPSKLMEDEIGKNLTLGIGVGLEDEVPNLLKSIEGTMPRITDAIRDAVDSEGLDIGLNYNNPKSSIDQSYEGAQQSANLSGNIETTIELDGRKVGKSITPIVNEELSLSQKRGRR